MQKCALALVALATATTALPAAYVEENYPLLWEAFKAEHGKTYAAREEGLRAAIFKRNMLHAAELEAAHPGAQFGATKFADLTAEEFKVYHSLSVEAEEVVHTHFSETELLQAQGGSKDWREEAAVTQVKNQGQCGSCWSFSTTGGIEGANALATGSLTSVSEQELVSCDKVDQGCNGGLMQNAFEWLVSNKQGAIVTEASYPYTSGAGVRGACKSVEGLPVGATIKSYKFVSQSASTEDQMAAYLLKNGPVSIAVDAQTGFLGMAWQLYKGGVLSGKGCAGTALDHGVLAVGVTDDYWIVKNSWGATWGEAGYIRLARGVNCCGLATNAVVPLV